MRVTNRLFGYFLLLTVATVGAVRLCRISTPQSDANFVRGGKDVVDMTGRHVVIPGKIRHAAGLEVLAYEKSLLLGQSDKVVIMVDTHPRWMEIISPRAKDIPKFTGDPNIENLMQMNVDVAFLRWKPSVMISKLRSAGVPSVISQSLKEEFRDPRDFQEATKQAVRLFGDIYGGDSKKKADDWCNYYDERIRFITGRTSRIPLDQRVTFYYARGPSPLITHGHNSNLRWYGEMAGGEMITKDLPRNDPTASMEDVLSANPEIIFVGRQYPTSIVLNNAAWRDVQAVKKNKVYALPGGVFFWDGSTEGVLMMEYMAKKFYPSLFQDLDMTKEVRNYFAHFYHYNLSDLQVTQYLQGVTP